MSKPLTMNAERWVTLCEKVTKSRSAYLLDTFKELCALRAALAAAEAKLADAEKHADALYELSVAQAMLLAAYRMHRQPTGPTLDTLNKHRNLFDAHAARRAARDGQEGTR